MELAITLTAFHPLFLVSSRIRVLLQISLENDSILALNLLFQLLVALFAPDVLKCVISVIALIQLNNTAAGTNAMKILGP